MTASDLSQALGGRKEGQEYRASCPVHGGRSLCFREKDGRLLVVCRAGCDQDTVVMELKRLGLWENGNRSETKPSPSPEKFDDTEKKARQASRIWAEAAPLQPGDAVGRYLKGRGIKLDRWPEDLRTHAGLDYWEVDDAGKPIRTGVFPCMLALIRSPEGRPAGIHRTWLKPDGSGKAPVEAPKKVLKVRDLRGGSIRLFPPRDGVLGLAEGTETALSAYLLTGTPTWAALNAGGIERAELPEEITRVVIFADNDRSMTGQRAAAKAALRFRSEGRGIRILIPDEPGRDFNDILQIKNARRLAG